MMTYKGSSDNGNWRQVAAMLVGRTALASFVLRDVIIVAGGVTYNLTYLSSVELFTPPVGMEPHDLGQWTSIQSMPFPMACYGGVVSNDELFMFGSYIEFKIKTTAQCFFHLKLIIIILQFIS